MSTYKHPQDDPLLKNLHYAMEYSGGKPSIRVSSGGGGSSSAPQPVELAAISVTSIPLPTNASTETTLQQVKSAILGQTAIASTLWTDNSGMYYVRKDVVNQETGEITVTFTDPTGEEATPGAGLKPVSSETNTQTETTYFTAISNGTGYATNDLIARLIILNTSVSPATIKSTLWVNMTAGATLPSGPLNANIVKTANDIVVTGSLPAGTNTIGLVGLANALPAGTNTIGSVNIANALPAGTNTIGSVNIANALPTGTNNLGSVNIANALPAGTNTIGSVNIANALPAGTNNLGSVNIANALPAGTNNLGSVNIANWIDGEISATEFRVINSFVGAAAGDVIALITTFDMSVTPPTSSVTTAINVSSMTALSSIPSLVNLVKLGEESYAMTYDYDTNDNLITETRTLGDILQSRTYSYDSNDNLESRTSWTNI